MSECPLCTEETSAREFDRVLLEDRHGTGEPPADSTQWLVLRRTLRREYEIEVSVPTLREHANEHVGTSDAGAGESVDGRWGSRRPSVPR